MPSRAPQAEKSLSGEGPENPKTLARFDTLERKLTSLTKNVGLVQNTNWLIIMVLFVAIIAIGFTSIFSFIQTIKSDTESRTQLIRSVEELKTEIEVFKRSNTDVQSPVRSTTDPTP